MGREADKAGALATDVFLRQTRGEAEHAKSLILEHVSHRPPAHPPPVGLVQ